MAISNARGIPAALLVLCLGGALASGPAIAEDVRASLRKVCAEDYKKYCAGVEPGGGRIKECMVANFEKFSPECRAGVEEWKKAKPKT